MGRRTRGGEVMMEDWGMGTKTICKYLNLKKNKFDNSFLGEIISVVPFYNRKYFIIIILLCILD